MNSWLADTKSFMPVLNSKVFFAFVWLLVILEFWKTWIVWKQSHPPHGCLVTVLIILFGVSRAGKESLSHSVVSLSIRLLFSVLLLFSPTPYPQAGLIDTQVILLWGVESWWCQWLVTLCIYCNICFYPLIDTSRGSVMGYWRFIFVLNQQNIQFDCKATDVCNLKVTYSLFTTEAVCLVFVMSLCPTANITIA